MASEIKIDEITKNEIIKLYKENKSISSIARAYGINNCTLTDKLKKWNVFEKRKKDGFTKEEIEILRNGYDNNLSISEIRENLNNRFTNECITIKAGKLGLTRDNEWKEWEINYLIENYSNKSLDEIEKILVDRNRKNIINFATKKLNLKSIKTWTEEEDVFIKNNYKDMTDKEMMEYLPNRTFRSIKWRRSYLGCDKINSGYGNLNYSKDGTMFGSQEEKGVYEYIKYCLGQDMIQAIGGNRNSSYVFILGDEFKKNGYHKFYPDFVIEDIKYMNEYIELQKPIIIEYYGMYNENKSNKVIINYNKKTKLKNSFYKNLSNITYIPIFPNYIKNNYDYIKEQINNIIQQVCCI